MRVDITSLFFNSTITGATATAPWSTSIGQRNNYRIDRSIDGIDDLICGLNYNIKTDYDKLDISQMSRNRELLFFSFFNKVYVNNIKLVNSNFIILFVKEHSNNHDGRLLISYPPYLKYNNQSINSLTYRAIENTLNCINGCWFVYKINIINQDELHFSAIVVDHISNRIYNSSRERSIEWNNLVAKQIQPLISKSNTNLNQIFYGPPGTGKTHKTITKSLDIIGLSFSGYNDAKRKFNSLLGKNIEFITFHQSYSYEDFIQGIKPVLNSTDIENEDKIISNNSKLEYELKIGIFKEICERAKVSPNENFVLIIDEINRGNISKIFGELITLIEDTKRTNILDANKGLKLKLPNTDELFSVPDNLHIIGTMNTADKSITSIDTALRRRFKFVEFPPLNNHSEFIKLKYQDDGKENEFSISNIMLNLNSRLEVILDKDHLIGHTYFLGKDSWENIIETINLEIIPLLSEYFYNDWEKISLVLGDNFRKNDPIIKRKSIDIKTLFNTNEDIFDDKNLYYYTNPKYLNFKKENESDDLILEFIKGFNIID